MELTRIGNGAAMTDKSTAIGTFFLISATKRALSNGLPLLMIIRRNTERGRADILRGLAEYIVTILMLPSVERITKLELSMSLFDAVEIPLDVHDR